MSRKRDRNESASTPPERGLRNAMPSGRDLALLAAIIAFGLLLRVVYYSENRASPAFAYPAYDAAFHDYWARALNSGDFSKPEFFGNPEIDTGPYFRPPAYPHLLRVLYAVSGGSYAFARIAQMLIGLGSVVVSWILGRNLFGRRTALIFATLMATYWTFIYFEGELLAPVLLVFLILIVTIRLLSWRDRVTGRSAAITGACLGALVLARPNALVIAPVACAWIFWLAWRRRRQGAAPLNARLAMLGLGIGLVVMILPATLRNWIVAGDPVLITANAGVNLYIGNNPSTDCVTADIPELRELKGIDGWTCFDQPAIHRGVEQIVGHALTSSGVSAYFRDRALDFIAEHPGTALAYAWRKACLFWGPAEIGNNKELAFERSHSNVLAYLPGFPLALALAILGLAVFVLDAVRRHRQNARELGQPDERALEGLVLIVGILAIYFASHLPFFVAGRYRVPIVPLLLLIGAYAIDRFIAFLNARDGRALGAMLLSFALLYGGSSVQWATYEPNLAQWHFDRGDAYRKQKNARQAMVEYRAAIEASETPDPRYHGNLGAALLESKRVDEAVAEFERALEIDPGHVESHANLSRALLMTGKIDLAIPHLQATIAAQPQDFDARYNLGTVFLNQRRWREAILQLEIAVELRPKHPFARIHLARSLTALALQSRSATNGGGEQTAAMLSRGIDEFARALDLAPRDIELRLEFARALAEAKQIERALREVERVLSVAPEHRAAQRLARRLRR